MAFDLKGLLRDAAQLPIAQYFNKKTDNYEVLNGADGGHMVAGTDGTDAHGIKVNTAGEILTQVVGAKSWTHGPLTVTSTAVQVKVGGSQLANCKKIHVQYPLESGTQPVYYGSSSGVTTSNGMILYPGDFISLDRAADGAVTCWVIAASGVTVALRIAEVA